MEDQVISVETAVLAKEKGFDVPVRSMYLYSSTLYLDKNTKGNYNDPKWVSSWRSSPTHDTLSAPTQSLLQKWLREVHNLHIYIDTTSSFDGMETHRSKYKSHVKVPFTPFKWTTGHYYLGNTYEDALEKGLFQALKLIESK